jgi:hypothetical protein
MDFCIYFAYCFYVYRAMRESPFLFLVSCFYLFLVVLQIIMRSPSKGAMESTGIDQVAWRLEINFSYSSAEMEK